MVEHAAVNRAVVGSSPTRGAIDSKTLSVPLTGFFIFALLIEAYPELPNRDRRP